MPDLNQLRRINEGLEKLSRKRKLDKERELEERREEENALSLVAQATLNEELKEKIDVLTDVVKNQQMIIEAPNVNVEVPDVIVPEVKVPKFVIPKIASPKIPEIKIPKITVPEPKVTVNVPKFPKIPTPEVTMNIPDVIDVGLDRFTKKKPLPVIQIGQDGKPVMQSGGSAGPRIVKIGDGGGNIAHVDEDGHLTVHDSGNGLAIAQGDITGTSFLHKFGGAPDFDTGDGIVDVWDGADDANIDQMVYQYSDVANINTFSSSDAGDTTTIEVQGLDENLNQMVETVVLNGQTTTTTANSFKRVFRLKNVGTVDNIGHIYCFTHDTAVTGGVPQTSANVRAVMQPANNQTLMAIYTIPAGKTGYMRSFFATSSGASRSADYQVDLFARPEGQVFQLKHRSSILEGGTTHWNHQYVEPEVFKEKTDIAMRVKILTNTITAASIAGGFDIVLVDN